MGSKPAKHSLARNYTDAITKEVVSARASPTSQRTSTSHDSGRQSKSTICRHFKKLIKCFTSTHHSRCLKLRKHVKVRKTRKLSLLRSSHNPVGNEIDVKLVKSPSGQSEMQQLHWLQSKNSLLSYALSKLAFFSNLSKEKLLKENDKNNGNDDSRLVRQVKFCYKHAPLRVDVTSSTVEKEAIVSTTETGQQISQYDISNNKELRNQCLEAILSSPKVATTNEKYNFLRRKWSTGEKEAIVSSTTETGQQISWYDISNHKELSSSRFLEKILSSPKVATTNEKYNFLRRKRSPEEIYRRNLRKFENLVVLTASTSSSCTSHDSIKITYNIVNTTTDGNNNINVKESVDSRKTDENGNSIIGTPQEKVKVITVESKESLQSILKLPPKRIIATSRNPVEVDTYFFEWIKKRLQSRPDSEDKPQSTVAQMVENTTSSAASSNQSKPDDDNNNNNNEPPAKNKPFEFLRRGGGRRASTAVRMHMNRSKSPGAETKRKKHTNNDTSTTADTTSSTKTKTTTTATNNNNNNNNKPCEKCGPCAGKGALAGAPPAYLDYGEGEQANSVGQAWKGKRKGDPVMDRLKNVDVVEEMTYLVPNPDCGGAGDGCQQDENEEDDCDYYAVCESCGEMEPLPEELKKELQAKRKKKKCKSDNTPVTYSRRQRFNFKNKGDLCEDDDGPPYSYEGMQCPGCRCPCCVAGLRRNPGCGCKCCQTMGPARKCNSFDEIPVGKNPQIRRILCPEEECARRREVCTQMMPDTSGMYTFDKEDQMFERQVPRTPTPIILEVEIPAPLNKEQLLAIGREIQEKKRRKIPVGRDAYCPPVEQDPMYLPPIYGQCQPCQPCCVPNNCCGQKPEEEKEKSGSYTGSSYGYSSYGASTYQTQMDHNSNNNYIAAKNTPGTGTTTGNLNKMGNVVDPAARPGKVATGGERRSVSSESLPTF